MNDNKKVLNEIATLKKELKEQVTILGHHYQHDDVIQFADITGDSLILAQKVADIKKPYIVFCGVHFMAETADMLTDDNTKVVLPNLEAGCSMADLANQEEIETAWQRITKVTNRIAGQTIIPITYVNCDANLKAFVGDHGGSICTSGNAHKIIGWGLDKSDKLLFFPDQHLGRNTCFDLDIPLDKMVIYDPNQIDGGLTDQEIADAKVILWNGYCSVHQEFNVAQIHKVKKNDPDMMVIVHPECSFEIVQAADHSGSTSYIAKTVDEAAAGSKFAIGTESNLVNRLASKYPDKKIISLADDPCICPTMAFITPDSLLETLRSIKTNEAVNVVEVPKNIANSAVKALNTMLGI